MLEVPMGLKVIYALIVGAIIFIPLERLFALRPDQKIFRRGWRTDIVHFLFTRSLSDIAAFVIVGFLILLVHGLISPAFQNAVAAQNRGLQFLEAVLIANVGGYVGHRLSHSVPFLWRFHSVHHSSSEMDWLAAARVHPLDQIVTKALVVLPLYFMGFSKATFGAYIALATLHAVFIHANIRFKLRPLRWIITTPAFHHWHHSADAEAQDKNFAGELPLLDLMFGTFHLPKDRLPETYGTRDSVPSGYFAQMRYPFLR